MELFQNILVYITLILAVAYIVKKFFLPSTVFASKKGGSKGCGDGNCGCH